MHEHIPAAVSGTILPAITLLVVHTDSALSLVPPLLWLKYGAILLITRHFSWFCFVYQVVMCDLQTALCCAVRGIALLFSYHLDKQLMPAHMHTAAHTNSLKGSIANLSSAMWWYQHCNTAT